MLWRDYYAACDVWDEEAVKRYFVLVEDFPQAKRDEVYEVGIDHFGGDVDQLSNYVNKALTAGMRFDFDQVNEFLSYGVTSKTANRLGLVHAPLLTLEEVEELEYYVSDEVYDSMRTSAWLRRKHLSWAMYCEHSEEWDDEMKLLQAARLKSFAKWEEVAEQAELFDSEEYASDFLELARKAGVRFPRRGSDETLDLAILDLLFSDEDN